MLAGALTLGLPASANGQERDPQEQFNEAVELATAGEHVKALDVCLVVLQRLPESERPRVHKLLGYSYMKLVMLPEAWYYLTAYLESSGKEDTNAGEWLQQVEGQLRLTHVKVTLTCDLSSAELRIPASAPSRPSATLPCPVAWWFKPGKYRVEGFVPGQKPVTVDVDVRERGDTGVREVRLASAAPARTVEGKSGAGSGGPTVISKPATPEKPSRALEWTLMGSGLALGAAGAVFHGLAYSKNEDLHDFYRDAEYYPDPMEAKALYDADRGDEVRPKEIAAYVLYGVGGAAMLAGIITYAVRDGGGTEEGRSALLVTPMGLPGGAGAMMIFEF